MFNRIDLVVVALLVLFFYKGWDKGLMRSAVGPMALGISSFLAILYFDMEKNFMASLMIVAGGTFFLSCLFTLSLVLSRSHIDPLYRNYVFWGSRLLGGIVSTVWKGIITSVSVFCLTFLPGNDPLVFDTQKHIFQSRTYHYVYQFFSTHVQGSEQALKSVAILKDPVQMEQLSSSPEVEKLASHPTIQSLINDERSVTQLKNKDYAGLMKNPKFWALLKDEELMREVAVLSEKIYNGEIKPGSTPPPVPPPSSSVDVQPK